ncbi:DUF3558 domain-containing protein [Streptomyces sannanensis]
MHRSAPRLTRILACAAVPVMLLAAGCSSDSDGSTGADSKKKQESSAPTPSTKASAEATVEPAKFAKLPDACKSISAATVTQLVPKAKDKTGKAGNSADISAQGSCSWNGLEDKGLKGSQYRWLDVSIKRLESEKTLGSGEERATKDFTKQVADVKATEGAKNVKEVPVSGIGDQATAITYDLRKTDEDFKYQVIVARTANVVVTLDYNGAGYQGAKTPDSAEMMKGAQKAAKEVLAAVATANQ